MTDWTEGYVADIGYTYGYYNELNPLHARLAFANAGLAAPVKGPACELGFGQGVSINIHAAASDTAWYGNDFNPAQVAHAQELARSNPQPPTLSDQSFAEFCSRDDLPEFAFVGLHGIWSWISDENRAVLVDFLRRKLMVGGIVYVSYNAQPGWATFVPVRQLITRYAESLAAQGGIVKRIDGAFDFMQKLLATDPVYARANPQVGQRMKAVAEQGRHYLAHEYFNRDWLPMDFLAASDWLTPAKLTFGCSATYLDHVPSINLTAPQQQFLMEMSDPTLREATRDFMVSQQFRRDYWVKGARALSPLARAQALRAHRLVLTSYRPDIKLKVKGPVGEADMAEAIYSPLLDLLADHAPRTVAEIESALLPKGIKLDQILQSLIVLAGLGHIGPAQDPAQCAKARPRVDKLNNFILERAVISSDIGTLASPVTGGGVVASSIEQLMLLALQRGAKTPEEWARIVWGILSARGERIVKNGAPLATPEENIADLTETGRQFQMKRLPMFKALQIA